MKGSSRRNCGSLPVKCIPLNSAGESFIDVIRTAVSLGGDCDTLTAIAGSIAEAFYGVSNNMQNECFKRLSDDLKSILRMFSDIYLQERQITDAD